MVIPLEEAIDCSKLPHIPAVSRLLPFIDINNEFQYNKVNTHISVFYIIL